MDKDLSKEAYIYIKENKQKFLKNYLKGSVVKPKIVVFTAGASGAGKTEYAIKRKEIEPYLIHIDTDEIRDFFKPIGYNGANASLFQKASSKGVDILYKDAINRGYSVILDTNFSNFNIANINIQKALKHRYIVKIIYILQDLNKCYEFAKAREGVTKRAVPKEVVKKSFVKSFETVLQIKEIYQDRVNLTLIDRINKNTIEDIANREFFKVVSKELL